MPTPRAGSSISARIACVRAPDASSIASSRKDPSRCCGFYGSREWLDIYDEQVTAMIESYHVVVLDAATLE